MSKQKGFITLAAAALLAAPAVAQDRSVSVQLLGGGYTHTTNLTTAPDGHFTRGFNLGGAVGMNLSKYFGIHGDFVFTRNKGLGTVPFAGTEIDRFFYGAHLEFRYPFGNLAPFIFGGGGAVTVDPRSGTNAGFERFTKVAAMAGVGLAYSIPGSPVDLLAEGKMLNYKWTTPGLDKTQWDMTYSVGLAYRFHY